MRCTPSSMLAGLLLMSAGLAYGAEGAGGTLDATKQELRQLQNDQKNKAGQGSDKLRLSTPGAELQIQDSDSSALWLKDKLKKEKKLKEQEKTSNNWLVEGVEKLEKEEGMAKGQDNPAAKAPATTETAPHAIDQSDPQYLLKLFDEQKKPGDAKAATGNSTAVASPDAFAPFMQGWLGSSPARGQFFDQFVKKSDGGATGGAPAVSPDYRAVASASAVNPTALSAAPAAEKTNPYLVEMNAPILTKDMLGEASAPLPSLGVPLLAPEAAKGGPVTATLDPIPGSRERAKAPLPGLADDKKYFPQLKRF